MTRANRRIGREWSRYSKVVLDIDVDLCPKCHADLNQTPEGVWKCVRCGRVFRI